LAPPPSEIPNPETSRRQTGFVSSQLFSGVNLSFFVLCFSIIGPDCELKVFFFYVFFLPAAVTQLPCILRPAHLDSFVKVWLPLDGYVAFEPIPFWSPSKFLFSPFFNRPVVAGVPPFEILPIKILPVHLWNNVSRRVIFLNIPPANPLYWPGIEAVGLTPGPSLSSTTKKNAL